MFFRFLKVGDAMGKWGADGRIFFNLLLGAEIQLINSHLHFNTKFIFAKCKRSASGFGNSIIFLVIAKNLG